MKYWNKVITLGVFFFLCGCEPFYDPVSTNDVPASPGTVWNKKSFTVKKTSENPYDASDLSRTMSLSQLLNIALYNNPSTRASWHAARASSYAYRASLSAYYPAIIYVGTLDAQSFRGSTYASSGNAIISNNTTTPLTRTASYSTYLINNLNLTFLLFDFGGRQATIDAALQTLYASNWQHDYTMQQVMLSVLNAYISYIGNKGLVEAFAKNLQDAEVALKSAQAMFEAGLATLTDVLSAQANLEQTRSSLFQAEGSEKTAFGEILIAIGLPPDSPISVETLPQELPVIEISGNISELLELAKKKRPDLGIAIAAIKQQEDLLAISYSSSMPTFSANANWTQVRFIWPRKPSGYNETAFCGMNFPIFQGFYYMNQQRQIRAQIEKAMANLDVQVAAVSTEVITNYYSFKAAEAALPSSAAAVEFSQRAYRGFVVQYKTGTASITAMLTALTALSNARAQEIITRTQWAGSLANLAFSVGILDENSGEFREAPPKKLSQISIQDENE